MKTSTYDETKETKKSDVTGTYPNGDVTVGEFREPGGRVTKTIDEQLGKMPFVSFLGLAAVSMIGSAALMAAKKKEADAASFVGLWAPCFILLGVYNKLNQIEKRMSAEHGMPGPRVDVPSSTAYLS
ncbi:MAG: hypothetical protein JST04_03045 [Bdellovibrionales bacterium]|nr:hypothetical protein [Bdellovibrionales bacterium]